MFHHMDLDKIQISSLDVSFLPPPKQKRWLKTDERSLILLLFLAPGAEQIFIRLTDLFHVFNPAHSLEN